LLSFSCSGFACGFFYFQRWQGIVTAVAVGCGPMANTKFGRRLESPPREQQPRTSHLRADAGPCIAEWLYFGFASAMILNSNTSLSMYFLWNSKFHVITLYSGHVCVYYASMLRCWHHVWILVRTYHPCLGVGCHSWYQSVVGQNPPGSSVSTTRGAGKPTLPPMEPRDL
jgi:hypothetical protein